MSPRSFVSAFCSLRNSLQLTICLKSLCFVILVEFIDLFWVACGLAEVYLAQRCYLTQKRSCFEESNWVFCSLAGIIFAWFDFLRLWPGLWFLWVATSGCWFSAGLDFWLADLIFVFRGGRASTPYLIPHPSWNRNCISHFLFSRYRYLDKLVIWVSPHFWERRFWDRAVLGWRGLGILFWSWTTRNFGSAFESTRA